VIGSAARIEDGLLERESELARATVLLTDAREARGRLLAIEGPAGIGKTVLLDAVCGLAEKDGFLVLRARGGELEREFPHGLVRQLFEAHLRTQSEGERAALLTGAAELAAPVVAPEAAAASAVATADASFAVAHGLYWLTANLADEAPLLLAVDDAQWSDAGSLRYLLHLARRLEGLPVLLAVCVRTGEPSAADDLLSQLVAEPSGDVLQPAPLSPAGVARVIEVRLGEEADPEFAAACHGATGGTPFLVGELVSALRANGIAPTRESVSEVDDIGPQAVARATVLRLGRLSPAAAELARAVAVLGTDGQLHRAARLAAVDPKEAVEAADALAAMNILRPGRPLEFVHQIVGSAVYDHMPAAARAVAHGRAADLLADEDADIDAIAAHLLLTEPGARPDTVERLRAAADHAVVRGAPESAATYLRRALEEGALDSDERAALLHELARAEAALWTSRPSAVENFHAAHRLARDPVQRGRIAYDLADALLYLAQWEEWMPLVESAIPEVEGTDRELAIRLEAVRAGQELFDSRLLPRFRERLPKLGALVAEDVPAARVLALLLACAAAWKGQPGEEVEWLLDRGLDEGRFLAEEGPGSWATAPLFQALVLSEDLDRALVVTSEFITEAQRRGSIARGGGERGRLWYGFSHRGWAHARRGDLVSAEADIRTAIEGLQDPVGATATTFSWYGLDVMLERPDADDLADVVQGLDVGPTHRVAVLALEARGRVRLARGDVEGGVDDLSRCGETISERASKPHAWGWRSALALAIAPTDRGRALELAHTDLGAARWVGLPRGIGIALRTLGLVEGGEEGVAHLEEAVSVLEDSPARLEYARALVELGAANRRANQRAAAREPLRLGLDLAHRCGATRLAERARSELAATGARPRREMLTGRDALTATEQRIAGMAAEGMSNPEIAQALFVTRKTVENHLGRIYGKLGINSRTQLADALAADRG
jgi:DNA-binding CsgD family transcriptional regulator